jgi:ketosteroid isomerase-like protein
VTGSVAVVRDLWDAFARGDFESALGAFDAEVEWDGRNIPDGRIGRGHEAVMDHARRWAAIWQDWTVEVEDLQEVAPGVVIAFTRERATSETGVEMDERHAEAYLVRNGKIVRRVGFSDPREATAGVRDWS